MSYTSFDFPHTHFYDDDLRELLKQIFDLKYTVTNFVSVNAIKYANPIQWNITSQYEKNTIVIDPQTGTAYISVAAVPSGIALTREEFWTPVFDLGRFVTRAARNFTDRYEADTTLTATFPTTAGEWLVWGDTLYRATANITAGDSYVVGGNIVHFTMETETQEIKNIIGLLADLDTEDKSNIVAAINEIVATVTSEVSQLDERVTNEIESRQNIIISIEELGADGQATNDDEAMTEALEKSATDGSMIYENSAKAFPFSVTHFKSIALGENMTEFRGTENGGSLNILVGSESEPATSKQAPTVFVQKHLKDATRLGDSQSHSLGAGAFESIIYGSESTTPNDGGYVALAGINKAVSHNLGSDTSQLWDLRGVSIGTLGEAITDGYNANVTTGLWANVGSCKLTDTEYDNLPSGAAMAALGEEINIFIRHKDSGFKSDMVGKGNIVGLFINNYQEYPDGETPTQKNFNFGININGTPIDGDYTNNNIDDWNGHYIGVKLDKIQKYGIDFGGYFKSGAYGIHFPQYMSPYAQRPAGSIYLGDTLMNLGQYYGPTSNIGDFGRSGKNLVYCRNAANSLDVVLSSSSVTAGTNNVATGVDTTTDPDTGAVTSVTPVVSNIADREIRIYLGGEEIHLLGKYIGPEPA